MRNTVRVNREITAGHVRVIDENGADSEVMPIADALRLAEAADVDLVEVSARSGVPVCRLMDYGKFKYRKQKKERETTRKNRAQDVKQIRLHSSTGEHDYLFKARNAIEFLKAGDKVKVTLLFRGREMTHQELGMAVIKRFISDTAEYGKPSSEPKIEGRNLTVVLAPLCR